MERSAFVCPFTSSDAPSPSPASKFGAVLDMVTDRCSTAGLLMVLSRLYGGGTPAFSFLLLMFIDLFSHWMHVQRWVDGLLPLLPLLLLCMSWIFMYEGKTVFAGYGSADPSLARV